MYPKSSREDASNIGDVNFFERPYFACSTGLIPEGPASAQVGEALTATVLLNSSILSLEALAGAGISTFEGFRTTSKALAILLPFQGVAVGAAANFDNPVMVGELCSFGCCYVFELFGSISST
jgi:hypothetical protein